MLQTSPLLLECLYQARKMSGQVYMCARGVEVAPIVKIIREYGVIMMVSWLVLSLSLVSVPNQNLFLLLPSSIGSFVLRRYIIVTHAAMLSGRPSLLDILMFNDLIEAYS